MSREMLTPICWAASTVAVEPLKDTPGSGGGAPPDPDRLKVWLSIFNDPDVWPSVIGAKPTLPWMSMPSIMLGMMSGMVKS